MTAGRVHAVVAAGLAQPELIARWQREPELLRACGVDPAELDLTALWKFAGLSVKVRHNPLRAEFPSTFRFLNVAGLEIEVFAHYASFRASQGGRYGTSSETKAQHLLAFLEQWLDLGRREHALLWDLIRHEEALARFGRQTVAVPEPANGAPLAKRRLGAASVPKIRGDVLLHQMQSNPRAVAGILREKSPRLERAPLGTFYFCYWRSGAAPDLHILELDELGFYLLSFVDGRRSVAELSLCLVGAARPTRPFLQALRDLAATGILAFERGPMRDAHEAVTGR